MKPSETDRSFTTSELVQIIKRLGRGTSEFDNDRLKEWHRRGGIVPGGSPGKGFERRYNFRELVYVASLALLADHSQELEIAAEAARDHTEMVLTPPGSAGNWTDGGMFFLDHGGRQFVPWNRALKSSDALRPLIGGVFVHPIQFRMLLSDALENLDLRSETT